VLFRSAVVTLADETVLLGQTANCENAEGLPVVVDRVGIPSPFEAAVEEAVEIDTERPGVESTTRGSDVVTHLCGVLIQFRGHPRLDRTVEGAEPVEITGEAGQRMAHGSA